MKVADAMSSEVGVISAEATVDEAARKMAQMNVGMLPVSDDGTLAGILTDRDLVVRVMARGGNAHKIKVREAMTPGAFYCFDDQDVRAAATLMEEQQIRRLVVLNRSAQLVGVVTVDDLALNPDSEKLACEVIQMVT